MVRLWQNYSLDELDISNPQSQMFNMVTTLLILPTSQVHSNKFCFHNWQHKKQRERRMLRRRIFSMRKPRPFNLEGIYIFGTCDLLGDWLGCHKGNGDWRETKLHPSRARSEFFSNLYVPCAILTSHPVCSSCPFVAVRGRSYQIFWDRSECELRLRRRSGRAGV